MARSSNQKLKLLYIMRILLEKTDETHPLSAPEIINELEKEDITAERKSIYSDIELLTEYGLDIISDKNGYYIGAREFELAELKLLVDSVQSSKFISLRKTRDLIGKIEKLASENDAKLLARQVFVTNRVKSMNESVYYNVDDISNAIAQNKRISFRYFSYSINGERAFRREGEKYSVSPYALMYDNENYYMLAFEEAAGILKHFRVDRICDISVLPQTRNGGGEYEKHDMSSYTKKVFGMYSGEEFTVRMRFSKNLVGAVIDKFGKDEMMIPSGDDSFTVSTRIEVSPNFFAWILSFGRDAEILSPEPVRDQLREYLAQTLKMYE